MAYFTETKTVVAVLATDHVPSRPRDCALVVYVDGTTEWVQVYAGWDTTVHSIEETLAVFQRGY